MDSDGYLSIKRSTYAMRVRKDASNPVFSEQMGLKQVTPDIPELLRATFGGYCSQQRPSTPNGKPLYGWMATDTNAARACQALLPYLRIKKRQALLMLELRESKQGKYQHLGYWFTKAHPDWQSMDLIPTQEVMTLLGYKSRGTVSQALHNGTLLALPYTHQGMEIPRFPRALVVRVAEHALRSKDGRANVRPPELIAWRERLYDEVRMLNAIGTGQHPITMRTGPYTPAAV